MAFGKRSRTLAGPTGFGLCRDLGAHGIWCIIVAPNRVPQMPGPKIKTDKRDARYLAWQLRMGSLTGIAIPDEELEALRDLSRAREDALHSRRRTRQQLAGLLLRHGVRSPGRQTWNAKYVDWTAYGHSTPKSSYARLQIETALPSDACNAVANPRISN